MSDNNNIIDFDKNDVPKNIKPKKRKLILSNLTQEQKEMIKNGSFVLIGVGLTQATDFYKWFDSGYDNTLSALHNNRIVSDATSSTEQLAEITVVARFADIVEDDMSFQEAFSSARDQVGPGGFFEWKGNVYSTYVKEEWDAMSVEEQQAYCEEINESADYDSLELKENQVVVTDDGVEYIDLDGDGINEIEMSDIDDDGDMDLHKIDLNDDGNWDVEHVDAIESNEVNQSEKPDPSPIPEKPEVMDGPENPQPQDLPESEDVVQPITGIGDLNRDSIPDAIAQDTDHDGFADVIVADLDQDGILESTFLDIDDDINLDVIIIDENQDGTPDTEPIDINRPFSMDEFIEITPDDDEDSSDLGSDHETKIEPLEDFEDDADISDLI